MRLFVFMTFSLLSLHASEIILDKVETFDANRTFNHDFKLSSHKPNYFLLDNHDFQERDGRLQEEAMFQFSFKKRLVRSLFDTESQLFFGYTQKSFWQVFDGERSRPFRETNYNPELYVQTLFDGDGSYNGFQKLYWGYEHESNGGDIAVSRSWDRLYTQLFYRYENLMTSFKLWYRFPENKKRTPEDPYGDDNPDILDYYGNGDIQFLYDYYGHQFGLFLRKRAAVLDLSIPLWGDGEYLYFRYFDGYGESLMDYDVYLQKLGLGIQITR